MSREELIQKTLSALSKLPADKANEVADFADYILKKYDEETLQKGIEKLSESTKAYDFLKTEESLYSVSDLKEKYKRIKATSFSFRFRFPILQAIKTVRHWFSLKIHLT